MLAKSLAISKGGLLKILLNTNATLDTYTTSPHSLAR